MWPCWSSWSLRFSSSSGSRSGFPAFKISKETPVVNGTDQEDDLSPAKSKDGINGSNTVGSRRTQRYRRLGLEERAYTILVDLGMIALHPKIPIVFIMTIVLIRNLKVCYCLGIV
jgi:hypothetical protein